MRYLGLLLCLFLTACQLSAPRTADLIARGANRLQPVLLALEEHEGNLLIDAHPDAPVAEVTAPVEKRWAPFWVAWETFVAAHAAWVDALEHNKENAAQLEAVVRAAFCALEKKLPAGVPPTILFVEGVLCGV